MKLDKDLDQILKQALSPEEQPGDWLNQNILRRAKENETMERKQRRKIPAAVMVAALTLTLGSATAFAAWNYLSPDEVAKELEDEGLRKAFQSKDAIIINQSQTCKDVRITLLGMVSGKNLSQYVPEESKDLATGEPVSFEDGKTYIVTAIEKVKGEESSDDSDWSTMNLVVSPLVKGLAPWEFNIYTMGGGCTAIKENGVEYRITECDNIEMFADRGLYLSVMDGAPSAEAYQYDEKTGEITRKETYEGVNALFKLPIDESKANPEEAEKFLEELEERLQHPDEEDREDSFPGETEFKRENEELMDIIATWKREELEQKAQCLEDLTQILTPDANGMLEVAAYEIEEDGIGSNGAKISATYFFEGKEPGEDLTVNVFGSDRDHIYIENYTLNEDGTITLRVYCYSES